VAVSSAPRASYPTDLPAITRVAERLGFPVRRDGNIPCPGKVHEHDGEAPRCGLDDVKGAFSCLKCGASGGVVRLVELTRKCDKAAAWEWLHAEFPETRRDTRRQADRPQQPDPLGELAGRRGWTVEALQVLGCTAEGDEVVFPMRDAEGKVVGRKRRKANDSLFQMPGLNPHKSHTDGGGKLGLFYGEFADDGQPYLVLEAETGAAAALSAGWDNVVATAGSGIGDVGRQALQKMLAGYPCVLAADPDDAGRKWLRAVGALLANVQCDVRFIPADSQQLDDRLHYESDRAATLRALVAKALPWKAYGDLRATEYHATDAGNGELLAALYGDALRYDHKRERWLMWDQHWWIQDPDGALHRMALEVARIRGKAAFDLEDAKQRKVHTDWAMGSESRQRTDAALYMARPMRPIADRGDGWDEDPWLLGVANGVVDLRTGLLVEGAPEQKITRHLEVPYQANAECRIWQRFLNEVFAGDDDLVGFVWRAAGYSLTGDVSEQAWFLLHGAGANGKSTLLSALLYVLGDYGHSAPFSTLEMKERASIPNDLAALAGRRLVTSSETTDGARLNEGRVKALTGGDPITARYLREEFFTYKPELKLWLAVNHLPRVDDDSLGFWRRVLLIPFAQQFKPADQIGPDDSALPIDPILGEKLRSEAAGILAWAVWGCREWQRGGLRAPDAVKMATGKYQRESDLLADFITERCVVEKGRQCLASSLYAEYRAWAEAQRMTQRETFTSTRFGRDMGQRFEKQRGEYGNLRGIFYYGIGLAGEGQRALED
jgi:putative DNA primase/helicase